MMSLKTMRARHFVPPASSRPGEHAATRPAAPEKRNKRQRGFGLIELLIAMVVLTVGLLAVAVLIMYGIRIQTFARDATLASGAGKQRLEILRNLPRTDAMRQNGGSLVADVAPYFAPVDLDPNQAGIDTPFVVRWRVVAGPAGTQDVTVRVVSTNPARQLPPIQFQSQFP